jgi:uncharacterized membrane protein YfcA
MDLLLYIAAGAGVGFLVGLTGVGGGSIMTPLLIMFGIPYTIAIGTDLLYATVTKLSGVVLHQQRRNIRWRVVLTLAAGSIPSSILTTLLLKELFNESETNKLILTTSLGVMLIVTSAVMMFKKTIISYAKTHQNPDEDVIHRHTPVFTFICGVVLGVCVTLSSVGAGAFAAAVLMILYTQFPTRHIVGTDLAHAVLLTFVAGLGHLAMGNVDFQLLTGLLIGSIPAVFLGTKLGHHLPERLMFNILAGLLFFLGLRFTFGF